MTRFNGFYKACATCGKEFYVIPSHSSQKYCSRACMAVAYEHAPRKPPKRVSKICLTCGKEFLVIPALTSKKYCSRECMAIAYRRYPPRNCPACGKQFQPDLNVHVVYCSRACFDKVGRQKPKTTKVCEQCGTTFEVTACHENKRFCSEKCHHQSMSTRITKLCKECGKPFEVQQVHKDRIHYCSQACREKKIEMTCEYCGKVFYVTRSATKLTGNRVRKTCSRGCRARLSVRNGTSPFQDKEIHKRSIERSQQYFQENPTKHPFYVDGSYAGGRRWRGPNWTQQKQAARARDNYTCQCCGRHESQFRKRLSVHHKISYRSFASYEEANALDNLICYCQSCHKKIENRAKAAS